MRIVFISDTHNMMPMTGVPDGDVLVHSGDFTSMGRDHELERFNDFMGCLPHKVKIATPGNHDLGLEHVEYRFDDYYRKIPLEKKPKMDVINKFFTNFTCLVNEELVVDGIKFYGSPYQPKFGNWAFNLERGYESEMMWMQIPEDTDILITHGPPHGVLDKVVYGGHKVGCEELIKVIERVKPGIHAFGHIHEEYGHAVVGDTTFINASICTLDYDPTNRPIVADVEKVDGKLKVEIVEWDDSEGKKPWFNK